MAIQDDNTVLCKGDLKAYHEKILPYLGGNFMLGTNVSDYYSEDEKIVGIFTDGKPIYQKTIISTTPNSTNTQGVIANLSSWNIDKVVDIKGCFNDSQDGSNAWMTINYYLQANNYAMVHLNGSHILTMQIGWSTHVNKPLYITLLYTKTTDAANSAVTTPGCYDINFPNTWPENKEIYFGNGLYGQRFTGTMATSTTTQELNLKTGLPTSTALVKVGGILKRHVMGASYYDFAVPCAYENLINASVAVDVGTIKLLVKNSGSGNIPYDVWCCYTK